MANKRVSELAQITTGELASGDLLLLSDVSAQESKKLTLADLNSYILTDGNLTGSFYGTASWSENSKTASYIGGAIASASYAATASYALNGSSGAASASWASQSLSSSNAVSASYSLSTGFVQTASFSTSSKFSDSASFVIYSGGNNGTVTNAINAVSATTATSATTAASATSASYAISASTAATSSYGLLAINAQTASIATYAQTASVGIITSVQASASWASSSISASYAENAVDAQTAITASYVLPNLQLLQYGVFLAITQSNYRGQLDKVDIDPFFDTPATTSIEAVGTMIAPYTSSILLNESVTLYAMNRATGRVQTVDSTPIYVNVQGQFSSMTASIVGNFSGPFTGSFSGSNGTGSVTGSLYSGNFTGSATGSISTILSGSMKIPFMLMGQLYLETGSYMLFVSASTSKILLESTRTSRFSVSSNIGQFAVGSGEVIQLTTNNSSELIAFSSSAGGPFSNTATSIVTSASLGDTITQMDISNVSGIRYIWTLNGLTSLKSNSNVLVSDVQGLPTSIITMSFQNGILSNLYDLSGSSAKILNVYNNQLTDIGALPSTMSYINCSNNPLLALPTTIPYGVTELYCSNTSVASPPNTFPTQTLSMSFANNSNLSLWLTTLPTALSSFDVSTCPQLTALPTIPTNVRYLNVNACAFTDVAQDNICSSLVSNGLLSGSLNLLGNASLLPVTLTRIATLQSRAWTVSY